MLDTLQFLLFDWLRIETLLERPRFKDHSRDTFTATLETCERIASDKFAPFNRDADVNEPRLEQGRVVLPRAAHECSQAYVESGLIAAAQDYETGGLQLPCVVQMAANSLFWKASAGLGAGGMLTTANANLLMVHGSDVQKDVFARNEFAGRWFGTMCLSEPQAGSSLSDLTTRAVPDGSDHVADPLGPRYRLFGNKMWISNGDHDLSENIIHLVLARAPVNGADRAAGVKGLSLFIVPKLLVDSAGNLTGERNDVSVAGLNHKLGFRGIPNAVLNFGEGRHSVRGEAGAIGYLVGQTGEGLRCMFHMMNEARIAVGMSSSAIGYAGYEASLRYARERRQGRPMGKAGKDPTTPQIPIIQHADVRRMLLAQKAYVEGGLALGLYCAKLVDEQRTGTEQQAVDAAALLDVLTPAVKSWPSRWCLEANSLAIQVHGGYGYTRDFPVEQYWRDNRLNMIHEGTHGIQGLDLLGRKVIADGGRSMALLLQRIGVTVARAESVSGLGQLAATLRMTAEELSEATKVAWAGGDPSDVLANATSYLEAFGHVVIAWIWLDLACAAVAKRVAGAEDASEPYLLGIVQAARYFYDFELPQVRAWLKPVAARNPVCREMQDAWF